MAERLNPPLARRRSAIPPGPRPVHKARASLAGLAAFCAMALAFVTLASCAGGDDGAVVVEAPHGPHQNRLPCHRGVESPCDLVIYQVMVSAYVDGSPHHDYNAGYGRSHHRGDLKGVIQSLDYIASLGVNAIWLTPIFDSHAGTPQQRVGGELVNRRLDSTGYFTRDYFSVDPKFGTLADAKMLVDEAHARGLYVFLDGVFGHHKGDLVPSPSGLLPKDLTQAEDYDGDPASYPGRIVDYSDPDSLAFYKEVITYWTETLGIDGWRLDQAYQVPPAAWTALRETAQKVGRARAERGEKWGTLGYMVGEIWHGANDQRLIASYGDHQSPALKSLFDFPTRYSLVQVLAAEESGQGKAPATALNADWSMGGISRLPDHAIPNLMLGNHDLVRFGDLLERANVAEPYTEKYWQRHKQAFAFMAAYSGPITLYYGEELGDELDGYGARVEEGCVPLNLCDDHVGRTPGRVPGVSVEEGDLPAGAHDLRRALQTLLTLRKEEPALRSGARTHLYSDDHLYVDLKSLGADRLIFAMNVGDEDRSVSLRADLFEGRGPISAVTPIFGDTVAHLDKGAGRFSVGPSQAILLKIE